MKRLAELLARVYAVSLYSFPKAFRLEYGGEMQRLFRDQCRDAAQSGDATRMAGLLLRSGSDWFSANLRERFDTLRGSLSNIRRAAPRGLLNEWVLTILMYLFATTTLVQAYVIPTGSMESTLRVGDHMLVDRAAYAKPGALSRYTDVRETRDRSAGRSHPSGGQTGDPQRARSDGTIHAIR